jgi:sugar phosphate permease
MKQQHADAATDAPPSDHKVRVTLSIVMLLCELSLGVLNSIIGPSLIDLQQQVKADPITISTLVTGRAAGHLVGVIVFSLLIQREINFYLLSGVCFLISSLLTIMMPVTTDLLTLIFITTINQFTHGAFNARLHTNVFDLWNKEQAGPYNHAVQLMYSAGGLIAPVLVLWFRGEGGENILFLPFAIIAAQMVTLLLLLISW